MDEVQSMYSHFSQVSSVYRQIRSTDVEPIAFIGETLKVCRKSRLRMLDAVLDDTTYCSFNI